MLLLWKSVNEFMRKRNTRDLTVSADYDSLVILN